MAAELQGAVVVVTGGAGFIGSSLVRLLLAAGATVRVVDNLVNGKRENLAEVADDENFTLHEADIRDVDVMRDIMRGSDIVYNLATLGVRHSIHSPVENHDVNATATLHMLIAARELNVGRYVYVSTSEVYGTARTVPMTEEHPTYPHTIYGGSKLAGESYTRAFHETYAYPTVVVRPFNAYGPRSHHEGDSGEVIPKFMLRCMAGQPLVIFGDGTQTRDFTYVEDSARGILLAGTHDEAIGKTLNLGSGYEIPINELAETVKQVCEKPEADVIHESPRPGDVLRLYADSSRAGEIIGFEPQISLETGLQRLKGWYDTQSATAEELLQAETVRNWEA